MITTDEVQELVDKLNDAIHFYYDKDQPTLSDAEYDAEYRRLVEIERQHPELVLPDSPTKKVGSKSKDTGFKKVTHRHKMLSLENAFSADEVTNFFDGPTDLMAEYKIDGLSLSLTYEKGVLVQAVTRGDGATGDDVTANALTIRSIPPTIQSKDRVEVRGEVYMSKSVFEELNIEREQRGESLFANPRNAASGSMKLKDPRETAARRLSFLAYGARGFSTIETQSSLFVKLQECGFSVPKFDVMFPSVQAAIDSLAEVRHDQDYAIDGIVFKINSMAIQSELGDGSRAPKWACAYKFPATKVTTKLNGISIQVGRLGTITPVAELEPVHIDGTTVKRASLCNQDEINRLNLNIGDIVVVEKAAEIIPKILRVEVKESTGTWKMPEACPCCNTALVREEGQVAFKCPNFDCDDQVRERLFHAMGKSALDMKGIGISQVTQLMDMGVRKLSDLFNLEESTLTLLTPSAKRKFIKARSEALSAPLWRKLQALGVPSIGKTTNQELATRYSSLYEILDDTVILGPAAKTSFIQFVGDNIDEIEALQAAGFEFAEERAEAGALTGKLFVITGGLMTGSRDQVAEKIMKHGGVVKSSVSKKVDYLVVGEMPGNGKMTQAKKHNTTQISEEDLFKMMGETFEVSAALEEFEY